MKVTKKNRIENEANRNIRLANDLKIDSWSQSLLEPDPR